MSAPDVADALRSLSLGFLAASLTDTEAELAAETARERGCTDQQIANALEAARENRARLVTTLHTHP